MMRRFVTALLLPLALAGAQAAPPPTPSDFAWRATVALPEGASMARLSLPASALVRLQSRAAHDIRVFNADGEAVAFARVAQPPVLQAGAPAQTPAYPAYPLFAGSPSQPAARGAVQIQLDQNAGGSTAWVRLDSAGASMAAPAPSAQRLPAVLFDTRQEKAYLSALQLDADLPANTLVHFALARSSDLLHWTPLALRGPLFRFEGDNAPVNTRLELVQPFAPEGHYPRLGWEAQSQVQVRAITGTHAPAWVTPAPVRAPLPPGTPDGNTAMTWPIGFATPVAALQLSTARSNTLVPVRILGRMQASQPWRLLAQTVVFRLDNAGQASSNPPVALDLAAVRWLRVEAGNAMALPADLQASAEFTPLELLVLASGKPPYTVALGRADTPDAAVDPALLTQPLGRKPQDLPSANLTDIRTAPDGSAASPLQQVLPPGTEPRSVALWAVLLGGVLVLVLVAYALMRQLAPKPGQAGAGGGAADSGGKV